MVSPSNILLQKTNTFPYENTFLLRNQTLLHVTVNCFLTVIKGNSNRVKTCFRGLKWNVSIICTGVTRALIDRVFIHKFAFSPTKKELVEQNTNICLNTLAIIVQVMFLIIYYFIRVWILLANI